jgi:hypothetical protein
VGKADSMIKAAGFTVGTIDSAFSNTIPLGLIIGTNPQGGTPAPVGAVVNLIVSKGRSSNLALGCKATASSEETNKGNTADKGNDGDTSTRWCASDGSTPQWWMVDLASKFNLTGSEVMWEFDNRVYRYKIEVSEDKTNWKLVVDKTNNARRLQIQRDSFSAEAVRYLRITITSIGSSNTWASFWEFSVFGTWPTAVPQDDDRIPKKTELNQNYPNPFNPSTTIRYALKNEAQVVIEIYNSLGQKVRTLLDSRETAGCKAIDWNGTSDDGAPVSSGLYFCQLTAGDFVVTKKMILMK